MGFKLKYIILGIILIFIFFIIDISLGNTNYNIFETTAYLFSKESTQENIILFNLRLPRAVMAILAGAGLSISGLLMQTLFRNPLAGPYILGINAGASLFVALCLLTGIQFFNSDFGLILSAISGCFAMGLLILFFALALRSSVSLLLVGLMIASFCTALISIIQVYSNAESLKIFTLWNMGTLQNTKTSHLPFIILVFVLFLISLRFIIKPLNALVLGETEAKNLGISLKQTRIIIICIVSGFTGLVTAYCGPIAFVGLAVPNLMKIMLKTLDHRKLIVGTLMAGSVFLLFCDILLKCLESWILMPINAVTSLIGAPFVIFLIMKRKV